MEPPGVRPSAGPMVDSAQSGNGVACRSADPGLWDRWPRSLNPGYGRAIDLISFSCDAPPPPYPPPHAGEGREGVEEGIMNRTLRTSRAALCAAAVLWSTAAPAQDTAIFKDKTVDIYTGYTVG